MATTAFIATALDAICLVVFVIAGRQQHDLGGGIGWFLTVLWPFAAGWFAVALPAGVYMHPMRIGGRLAATIIVGIGIALLLRSTVTHRSSPVAFVIVSYGFITLTTVGWRLAAAWLRRRAPRPAPEGSG